MWKPISEAPRDGTPVMLAKISSGKWRVVIGHFADGWWEYSDGVEADSWPADKWGPSHWATIPEPPAREQWDAWIAQNR